MSPTPSPSKVGSTSKGTIAAKTSPNKVLKQSPDQSHDTNASKKCSCSPTQLQQTGPQTKSHKVEGKNKKSLHHKQQASLEKQNLQHVCQPTSKDAQKARQDVPSRRQRSSGSASSSRASANQSSNRISPSSSAVSLTLDDFYKRAQELKADIQKSLEKASVNKTTDRPIEVVKLKEDILKLAGLSELENELKAGTAVKQQESPSSTADDTCKSAEEGPAEETAVDLTKDATSIDSEALGNTSGDAIVNLEQSTSQKQQDNLKDSADKQEETNIGKIESSDVKMDSEKAGKAGSFSNSSSEGTKGFKSDVALTQALEKLTLSQDELSPIKEPQEAQKVNAKTKKLDHSQQKTDEQEGCDPYQTTLDEKTKFCALMAAFKTQFEPAPHLLEPICRQLAFMSDQKWQLQMKNEQYQAENQRLLLVKQKLENLCRELQKSNNAIRCESLELIKAEQGKAKAQTTKIQSTLSGVIKLFDENQQRNMALRQENQDLQNKLKALLEHCDNCEKSVETALRQRDIENRLLKTELAKANLSRNEEKEKFLGEKQELLQILSMMQEQQHRIEGQEAKLRSDLSSYASKYDECQAVINKGMNRFQTESKKMLKTIEKSKQDYKVLLTKYEASNKKMSQLLEEKQYWDRTLHLANKKIETLEKLCRALRGGQKPPEQPAASTEQRKLKKINLPPPPKRVVNEPKVETGKVIDGLVSIKAIDLSLESVMQSDKDLVIDSKEKTLDTNDLLEPQIETQNQITASEQTQEQQATNQQVTGTSTGKDNDFLDKGKDDDLPKPEFVI